MIILLQSVTMQFRRLFRHISSYKMRQSNFITKCDRLLLQSASVVTNCDSYYKVRRNNCIIPRCLYSLFILFCSLISVCKKRNIKTMLTLPYPYNWQKSNNKMKEKKSQEYQSMDPEYVTEKINSRILDLLLRRFCYMIFVPSRKS